MTDFPSLVREAMARREVNVNQLSELSGDVRRGRPQP